MLHSGFVSETLEQRHSDGIWRLSYLGNNLATLLFRLEHCPDIEEFENLVHTISRRLRRPRYAELYEGSQG